MSEKLIKNLVIIGAVIFALFTLSGSFISFSNNEIDLRNQFEQKIDERTAFYDKMFKVISQKTQIAVKNDSSFIKVVNAQVQGQKNGEQVMWAWVQQSNPTATFTEVTKLYADLSRAIEGERAGFFEQEKVLQDVKVNNTVKVMRYMLSELTNIESKEYWDNIDDTKLDEMLNYSDGDFKEVIQTLMDIMLEISHNNAKNDIRQISILTDKLIEFKEGTISTIKMQKTLSSLNLDIDKLMKMEQGDEIVMKEFKDNIINELEKQNKPKRQYIKKTKK